MVLEAGGGETGAAITAASAALADAGIELRDLAPACHVARSHGALLLDPSTAESAQADGALLLGAMPTWQEVTVVQAAGAWAPSDLAAAQQLALGGCVQLRQVVRGALVEAAAARAAES